MNGRYTPTKFEQRVEAILADIRAKQLAYDPASFPQRAKDGLCFYCNEPATTQTGAHCDAHLELVITGKGIQTR